MVLAREFLLLVKCIVCLSLPMYQMLCDTLFGRDEERDEEENDTSIFIYITKCFRNNISCRIHQHTIKRQVHQRENMRNRVSRSEFPIFTEFDCKSWKANWERQQICVSRFRSKHRQSHNKIGILQHALSSCCKICKKRKISRMNQQVYFVDEQEGEPWNDCDNEVGQGRVMRNMSCWRRRSERRGRVWYTKS